MRFWDPMSHCGTYKKGLRPRYTHMGVVPVVFVVTKGRGARWTEEYLNAKKSSPLYFLYFHCPERVCVVFYIPLEPLVAIKLLWESTAVVDSLLNLSILL